MSLELHKDCRRRLVEELSAALSGIFVKNGRFLDFDSVRCLSGIDSILPGGKLRETLAQYIGELPFSNFVQGALSTELYKTQQYIAQNEPVALSETDNYHDLAKGAERLVEQFASLPWKYTMTAALPFGISDFFLRTVGQVDISMGIKIVISDEQFASQYPLPNSSAPTPFRWLTLMELMGEHYAWEPDKAYLQVEVSGFVPIFGSSTPLDDGIDYMKSFFGLGIALHIFKFEKRFGEAPPKQELWVHRMPNDTWEFERSVDLDRSVSDVLHNLAPEDFGGAIDYEPRRSLALHSLEQMRSVFSFEPRSSRLLLAAQWLFDSYSVSNAILALVQATVVLEILLGDKAVSDVIGLGELLRNRCAYLISRTHAEREVLLQDFRRIYDVRSHIVHAGKKRLNMEEWQLLMRLRWICQRVIQEEVRLFADHVSGV
jgi:hypothetical protein